jgi:hypothetical protein
VWPKPRCLSPPPHPDLVEATSPGETIARGTRRDFAWGFVAQAFSSAPDFGIGGGQVTTAILSTQTTLWIDARASSVCPANRAEERSRSAVICLSAVVDGEAAAADR